jgi:transposase-like protein
VAKGPERKTLIFEVFVKINCKLCYLWRAVDHEGEVSESVVTAKRDKVTALKFLKRIMEEIWPTAGRHQKPHRQSFGQTRSVRTGK